MRTVSVVMATYNGATFLESQLSSLAAQYQPPLEVIISDDRSSDDTLAIAHRFRARAPFPVIVHQNAERLGYGANFLSAARLASGEHLAFCDQDDVWHRDKLRLAVGEIDRTGADLYVHTADVIDGNGRHTGRKFTQGINRSAVLGPLQLGPWSVFYGCSMVFSRTLLTLIDESRRGDHTFEWEGLLSHDLWVYFLATSLGTVALDTRSLVDYRQHGANTTPALGAGLRARVRALGVAADPRLRRDEIARHRARLMTELGERTSGSMSTLAARAAHYWATVADLEERRTAMYLTAGLTRRTRTFLGLAQDGAYRSFPQGGLGAGLAVKDAAVGVLRARSARSAMRNSFGRSVRST